MNEKEFVETVMSNICLTDPRVSLEAKGLYYTALINACNNKSSLLDLFRSLNEDEEFIYRLTDELIRYGYLVIGIPVAEENVFIFKEIKDK